MIGMGKVGFPGPPFNPDDEAVEGVVSGPYGPTLSLIALTRSPPLGGGGGGPPFVTGWKTSSGAYLSAREPPIARILLLVLLKKFRVF